MEIVCYKKCSICKRALAYLNGFNVTYSCRDIKANNPSYEEIKDWHQKSNIDIDKFFNNHGSIYRELNLKERLKDMSLDEKYKLLASNGMLVKRPILIKGDIVLVGFKPREWNEIIF